VECRRYTAGVLPAGTLKTVVFTPALEAPNPVAEEDELAASVGGPPRLVERLLPLVAIAAILLALVYVAAQFLTLAPGPGDPRAAALVATHTPTPTRSPTATATARPTPSVTPTRFEIVVPTPPPGGLLFNINPAPLDGAGWVASNEGSSNHLGDVYIQAGVYN